MAPTGIASWGGDVVIADFTGDGSDDVWNWYEGWSFHPDAGGPAEATASWVPVAADFDGDGQPDVWGQCAASGPLKDVGRRLIDAETDGFWPGSFLASPDFWGDGSTGIVVEDSRTPEIRVFAYAEALLVTDDGVSIGAGDLLGQGDLDGDGAMDVLVAPTLDLLPSVPRVIWGIGL